MIKKSEQETRKWHKRNGMICILIALGVGIIGAILFDKDTIGAFVTAVLATLFWIYGSYVLFVRP